MRFGWSLQARFLLATSVLAIVLCTAFGITVKQFIELLEDELLNRTLVREMQEFKTDVTADPHARPPSASGLNGYIVRTPADRDALPPVLVTLSPGVYEDIPVHGRLCYVAVDDVRDSRLYVVLDTERVEAIERSVVSVAVAVGLAALGLAAVIGVILSRAVMRPVTELANSVAHLDPAHRNERLTNRFANKEVGIIAAAFDNYMERLERVLEREQAFTEDASHELRTPLSIIGSAAELLMEEPTLAPSARERVLRIRRASAQMQSLIEALLFLARGEHGAASQTSALDQIVRESVEVIAAMAAAKSLVVTVATEPVQATGSPVMIACVINNLLLNAVNFTQEGTIDVKLSSSELTVQDSGVGIPPQDLSRIFERRYRGPQSRGLGLGLYLVSRICQRLGWRIEAHSAPGLGTTFRIQLAPEAPLGLPPGS
ncbi:MAG TPA: HAMP domain-containing sensor histidine kinase [Steroidobacteraceae bacterium]|nr:HAMP domain-containing sensor histidine kinase [Steroidobacteraceae bacterium]